MRVFDETGTGWRLEERVAAGGEGEVFRLSARPEWCVKLYHKRPLAPGRRAKLAALRALSPAVRSAAAVPLSLVAASAGSHDWIGVLLPFVEGHDIYELYNPQGRRAHFPHATFEFVVAAAFNLAAAFETVHAHGIVVGDISEQNIRVRPDATLTLIDCDGFQLTAGGQCFASNTGTPIWTPPELQGLALEGTVRTRNHDGFGLAQLIFLLLFGGRYPFAGRPLSGEALSPEEAIAKYAFAFDPAPARPLLEPPPGAPRLDALPERFTQLFLRAFRQGAEAPGARPSPQEWGAALAELRGGLVRCSFWEAHVHWKGAPGCPWCGVLEGAGVDLFPGPTVERRKGAALGDAAVTPEVLAQRLLSLKLEPIHLSAPSFQSVQEALREAGVADTAWWVSLSKGLGLVGGFLLGGQRRVLAGELEVANRGVASFDQRAASLFLGYAGGLRALGQRAQQLGGELKAAASRAEDVLERYLVEHRDSALRRYLEGFLLRRYEIQGVSQGRKAALLSHNIVTAADVTREAVIGVPGFSVPLAERLLRWRRECERGFRPVEARFVPEAVRAEAAEEGSRSAAKLLQQGLACEAHWNKAQAAYAREHGILQTEYRGACTRRALLEARLLGLQ
jgi:DNA-binding helix-hairpin-helix protein with protein kinase domain